MYTESIYIDINGSNENGDGSKASPYATIEYALSKATTTNPAFYIGKGTFYITRVVSLTTANHTNNIIGTGLKTRIMVNNMSMTNPVGPVNVYDCVFQPVDTPSGNSTNGLFYTTNSTVMIFYNCLFLKSDNGQYPTKTLIIGHNNQTAFTNKYFYKCTSNIPQNNSPLSSYGSPIFKDCAFLHPATITITSATNCKNDITGYNSKTYMLTEDNSTYGVYSGDNAWNLHTYLIYQNGKYYSIKEEYFNGETYNPVSSESVIDVIDSAGFNISELTTEVTISEKTFKPIDKFTGKIQLVSTEAFKLNTQGLKSSKELILAKDVFSTKLANNIDFFNLNYTITNNGSVKSAVSDDNGETWKTWNTDTSSWETLVSAPPLKKYSELSSEELKAWNTFRDEIDKNGFIPKESLGADYNKLSDTLMFAYVFNRPTYDDTISMETLKYQFDAKGSFEKTDIDSVKLKQTEDQILVVPNTDMSLLRVNIGNYTKGDTGKSAYEIAVENGFEGSEKDWLASLKGSSADITGYTDDEILNGVKQILGLS